MCREGSNFKLYLDGDVILEDTMAKDSDLGIENINLGASPGWGAFYRDHYTHFDELKVYSRALNAADVKAMTQEYKTSN